MTHWFTSDLHLGHENVALMHRGARSVEQHDQAIVENLLRCLQSGDDLYILGDLSLGRKRGIDHAVTLLTPVARRVGYKHMHLIRGNHDPKAKWATQRLAEVFSTITDTMVLQVANTVARTGVPAGCSSNAFDPKVLYGNSLTRDETHVLLYGHTHDQTPTRPEWGCFDVNVGVDAWAYKPVSLDHIRARINL
jgi:calcineurin-like phosphoesterase family protein